jgi:hypothetical protein
MAKKKPAMPSKTCVDPQCGVTMHARTGVCPKCGKEQPSKTKSRPKAQPTAPRPQRPAAPQPAPGGLPQAVSFVRQVGGLDQAKKLLTEIEEIKKL